MFSPTGEPEANKNMKCRNRIILLRNDSAQEEEANHFAEVVRPDAKAPCKPRATAQIAQEYDMLKAKLDAIEDPVFDEEAHRWCDEINRLIGAWDWDNYEFVDPETGKKGVKDVTGRVLVPARYDFIGMKGSYLERHTFPQAVVKDGKFGIVSADGSGKELSEFRFDVAYWQWATDFFLAYWGGDKEHYGFIDIYGHVICPNILTGHNDEFAGPIMVVRAGEKYGIIDVCTHQTVLPEYDAVEILKEAPVVFHKDGCEGYVTLGGEFVTIKDAEEDPKYEDANYFADYWFD